MHEHNRYRPGITQIADERDKYKAMYEMEKTIVVNDELEIMRLEEKIKTIRGVE